MYKNPEVKKQKARERYFRMKAESPEVLKIKAREAKKRQRLQNPERQREINRNYAKRHPDKVKEGYRNWAAKNKDHLKEYQKKWRHEWKISGEYRKYDLKKSYNMTVEGYDALLESQNYCCAICGIEESKCPRRLFVDHDHKTGKVRGLLCITCNFVLGYCKDDIDILFGAVNYLQSNG